MRITCGSYVDDESDSLETLARLMESIRTFQVQKPEFEVTKTPNVGESFAVFALFFEHIRGFAGWMVCRQREGEHGQMVFCLEIMREATIEALLCGSPETIKQEAVLTTEQVLMLFSRLIEGAEFEGYKLLPLLDIFRDGA